MRDNGPSASANLAGNDNELTDAGLKLPPAAAWPVDARQLRMAARAVHNFTESFCCMDIDGRILYVNPAAETEPAYSAEDPEYMGISDIDPTVPPEVWGKGGEIERMLKSGGLRSFVTQHRHRDGHLIPVEINSAPFAYDGEFYSLAICRDISERLAAEAALRASEAKFTAMFSMTPDPMVLTRLPATAFPRTFCRRCSGPSSPSSPSARARARALAFQLPTALFGITAAASTSSVSLRSAPPSRSACRSGEPK